MKEPMNDLERAFAATARGPEGRPEFFRQLRDSQLFSLRAENRAGQTTFTAGNGGGLNFQIWAKKKEVCIPIFTSAERVEQGLKKARKPFHRHSVLQMKGEKLFQAIAARKSSVGVIINPDCGTGEMFLDAAAVRLLADGSILKPLRPEKMESGIVRIVEPADYPTQLVASLHQFLRRSATVRAAWLFRHQAESPKTESTYIIGFVAADAGQSKRVEQDLIVVAKGVRPMVKASATVLDLTDPAVAKTIAKHTPFYAAPDFPNRDEKLLRTSVAVSDAIGRIVLAMLRPIAPLVRWVARNNSRNQ